MTASHRTSAPTLSVKSLIRFTTTRAVITATSAAAPGTDHHQPVLPLDFSVLAPAAPAVPTGHRVLAVGQVIESARSARLGFSTLDSVESLSIA